MGSAGPDTIPTLRWGIIGTGLISSWFAADITLTRKDAQARHIIQAIGSSSVAKGTTFAQTHIPNSTPTIYGSYSELYADPAVDIVYIGTPHAFHAQNCLDAIAAGKHVLCEKAFTLTAREARTVLAAAQARGVFLMEAMWTRFTPLVRALQQKLFTEKVIGDVRRTFCDFAMDMQIGALGPDSRLRNPALGAGSLLDIGIYSVTWGLLTLDAGVGTQATPPTVIASQSLANGIDIASSVILHYPSTGRQGILTSSTEVQTPRRFCRIEGSKGYIVVEGLAASVPQSFTVYAAGPASSSTKAEDEAQAQGQVFTFEKEAGMGFFYEADAVALDIAAGRTESAIMPHAETLRVMELMDEVRRQGGARFPQDDA